MKMYYFYCNEMPSLSTRKWPVFGAGAWVPGAFVTLRVKRAAIAGDEDSRERLR